MSKTGLAIIGVGMAAKPHVRALKDLGNRLDVRGVYSRSPDRCGAFAKSNGFPIARSLNDIVDDPKITAILLLTPPNARLELVDRFAAAGKHILMEKPVERTSEAARAIVGTCDAAKITLGIVFQQRFRAASLKLKELMVSGRLGRLGAVQVAVPWWRPQSYYDEPGRGTLERDGGGVLISQAIHTLDLMLWIAGPVSDVQAMAGTTCLHEMESEDFVSAGLRFQNGAIGSLIASTASFPGRSESLVLDCELASARIEDGVLTIYWRSGEVETFGDEVRTGGGADPMDFPHDWHRDLISDFIDAVEGKAQPMITGREALNVHYLIDALLASSASRCATKVETCS